MNEVELEVVDLKEADPCRTIRSDLLMLQRFGRAIAENYGHFAELRDAVGEMEDQRGADAGGKDQNGRVPVFAGTIPLTRSTTLASC